MSLTEYTLDQKKIWQSGQDYEQERIIKLLLDYGTTIDTRTAAEMIREK